MPLRWCEAHSRAE